MKPNSSPFSIARLVQAFFTITAAAGIALYAWLGVFIRPLGDDYCISARLIGYNVFYASLVKYLTTSNRFSNQFVAWLSDLFGPRGVALLAVAMLLLWLAGMTWFLAEAARALRLRWSVWTGLLIAELVLLVSWYTSPNLFQSVYWRPGLMTYFMPLVIYSFIFAGLLRGVRSVATGGTSWWMIILFFLAAFITGGLSETDGALHISILALALAATFLWNKGQTRRAALLLITATLAGALCAIFAMFITPANAMRMQGTETPGMLTVLLRALTFAVQFLLEAARLLRIPLGFIFVSGALLAWLKAGSLEFNLPRRAWLGLVLIPLLAYLLTAATFAPSAYGQSYPVERVRFPAHVVLTVSLFLEGGLLGLLAARWSLPRWTTALATGALLVVSLYPLWTVRNNLALIPEYREHARSWDERDAHIREQAQAGAAEIQTWDVPGVAGVNDLGTRPSHWINYCAAIYYGVDAIAVVDGQNPSP